MDDLIHFSTVIIPSITREPTQSCVENASGDAANPDYVTSEHECFDTSSNQPPSRLEPTLTVPPGVDKDVDETSKAGCLGDASGDGRMKERVDYEEAGSKVHDESNGSRHVGLSVVGHSMGALIAMYATLESPRLFRRVREFVMSLAHGPWWYDLVGRRHNISDNYSACMRMDCSFVSVDITCFCCLFHTIEAGSVCILFRLVRTLKDFR